MSEDLHLRAIEILKAGSRDFACAGYLRSVSELERIEIYTKLEYDRLSRKYASIMEVYRNDAGEDWTQLLFILVMDMVADVPNRPTFMELARRIPMKHLLRDRDTNPHYAEAILVGATGLLDDYVYGGYAMAMKRDAKYLLHKYDIKPLVRENWSFQRVSADVIMMKLSQIAELFTKTLDIFDRVIACETKADVDALFGVAESQICARHHSILRDHESVRPRKIGAEKRNVLGLNVVVLMQYVYGYYIQSEELCGRAQELNESLLPESNSIIRGWRDRGVVPHNGFESQALLELSKMHCKTRNCEKCYVGKRASRDLSWLDGRSR